MNKGKMLAIITWIFLALAATAWTVDKPIPKLTDNQRAELAILQRDAAKVLVQLSGQIAQLQAAYQQVQDKINAAQAPVDAALRKFEVNGYRLNPDTLEYEIITKQAKTETETETEPKKAAVQ